MRSDGVAARLSDSARLADNPNGPNRRLVGPLYPRVNRGDTKVCPVADRSQTTHPLFRAFRNQAVDLTRCGFGVPSKNLWLRTQFSSRARPNRLLRRPRTP